MQELLAILAGKRGRHPDDIIPAPDWRTATAGPDNPNPTSMQPKENWAPINELIDLLERAPNTDFLKRGEPGRAEAMQNYADPSQIEQLIPPDELGGDRGRFQELIEMLTVPGVESYDEMRERYRSRPRQPVPDAFPPIG